MEKVCPECYSDNIRKKEVSRQKTRTINVYRCCDCSRTFRLRYKRRYFQEKFKREAVKYYIEKQKELPNTDFNSLLKLRNKICEELGIERKLLCEWVRRYTKKPVYEIDEKKQKQIVRMYITGFPISSILQIHKISKSTLYRVLKENKIKKRLKR